MPAHLAGTYGLHNGQLCFTKWGQVGGRFVYRGRLRPVSLSFTTSVPQQVGSDTLLLAQKDSGCQLSPDLAPTKEAPPW